MEPAAPRAPSASPATDKEYPWYGIVQGGELEQGDIIESCPVFMPPSTVDVRATRQNVIFDWGDRDLIVMTQKGNGAHVERPDKPRW